MIIPILSASYYRPLSLLEKESPTIFSIFREKSFVVPTVEVWFNTVIPRKRFVLIDAISTESIVFPGSCGHDFLDMIGKCNRRGHIIFSYDIIWTCRRTGDRWLRIGKPVYEEVRITSPNGLFNEINAFINRIRSSGQAEAC